jgi:hypothetical protein
MADPPGAADNSSTDDGVADRARQEEEARQAEEEEEAEQAVEDAERWGLVLGLLLGSYLLSNLLDTRLIHLLVAVLLLGMVLLVVLGGQRTTPGLRRLNLASIVVVLVLGVVEAVHHSAVLLGLQSLAMAVTFATMLLIILVRLLRERLVTLGTVFGAIDVYVLLGFTFCWIYVALDAFGHGNFFVQTTTAKLPDFVYFSLITLTTVGFGDLTPAHEAARSLVAVEALLGQVLLVTLVARLVAMMGQRRDASMVLERRRQRNRRPRPPARRQADRPAAGGEEQSGAPPPSST